MMQCAAAQAGSPRDVVVFREPTLAEMLADLIVQMVMQADAVDPDDLRALMDQVGRERR